MHKRELISINRRLRDRLMQSRLVNTKLVAMNYRLIDKVKTAQAEIEKLQKKP